MGELKGKQAFVYMDDVLVPSKTREEGFKNLEAVLHNLSTSGFRLNHEKCRFFESETEFLELVIKEGTVRSERKVTALTQAPIPCDVKGVRQFLGLATYFRRFIERFSAIIAPISALLKKDAIFTWSKECENARQVIINKLTNQPLLHIYNPALEYELHTDESAIGIGAALFQKEHGVAVPIAYYSRRTTDYESKYHSVEHFRTYLYGVHFTIFTDCNSVRATSVKKDLHPRVARWWIKLQDYDFSIAYRPGHKMAHVDYCQSRNPVDTICVVNKIDTSKCESIRDF